MRCFVAIPLPDSLKDQLQALQVPVDGIRWQPAHQMHITLKFLGEVGSDKLDRLVESLCTIEQPAFWLPVHGWGMFPGKGTPKIIWAGVESIDALFSLQESVEQACFKLGFETEKRAYKPHITLGKVKGKILRTKVVDVLEKSPQIKFTLKVESFTLFESELTSDGAIHRPVQNFKLK